MERSHEPKFRTVKRRVRSGVNPEGTQMYRQVTVKIPVLKKNQIPPPPEDLFPVEVGLLITPEQHERVQRGTGSQSAHIEQALEDKED